MSEAIYLIYNDSDGGSLFQQCSTKDPPNWIAKAIASQPLPPATLTAPRVGIKNHCYAPKEYYYGWCQFVKNCKGKVSRLEFNQNVEAMKLPHPIQIVIHHLDNSIERTTTGFDMKSFDAIAVIPLSCTDFNMQSMERSMFMSKARTFYAMQIDVLGD